MYVCPASLSCISHSIDIWTVAIKNIRNIHAVSINQIADILHFKDNGHKKRWSHKVLSRKKYGAPKRFFILTTKNNF